MRKNRVVVFISIISLTIGVGLRLLVFAEGSPRMLSSDEAITALYASGRGQDDVLEFSNSTKAKAGVRTVGEFLAFTRMENAKPLLDIVPVMAREDSQHPPLNWLLTSAWMRLFGDSVNQIRGFSLFIGLCQLPLIFLVGKALFPEDRRSAWIALALGAVSPFLWIFSLEAREQSLFFFAAFSMLFCLLKRRWISFQFSLTIAFYTSLFAGPLLLGFVTMVIFNNREFGRVERRRFFSSLILPFFAFVPWVFILVRSRERLEKSLLWLNQTHVASNLGYLRVTFAYVSRTFFDLNLQSDQSLSRDYLFQAPLVLAVLIGIGFSIRHALKTSEKNWAQLLGLSWTVVGLGLILVPDLIGAGSRIIVGRYWVVFFLGAWLLVFAWLVYFFTKGMYRRGVALIIFFVFSGSLSMASSVRAWKWWINGDRYLENTVVKINETPQTTIYYSRSNLLLSILRYVHPDVLVAHSERLKDPMTIGPHSASFILFDRYESPQTGIAAIADCPVPTLCSLTFPE